MSMKWLANLRVCQNHLESLLQHRFLGSISRFSELAGQGWGLTVCISSPYPDDGAVESKLPNFRSWRSQSFVFCFHTKVYAHASEQPSSTCGCAICLHGLQGWQKLWTSSAHSGHECMLPTHWPELDSRSAPSAKQVLDIDCPCSAPQSWKAVCAHGIQR